MPGIFDSLFQMLYRLSPDFSAFLEDRLPEDGVIFDVGSFRGDFSRYFIKRRAHRPGSLKVYLFDGNPETRVMVADLLSQNVVLNTIALSNREGDQDFFVNTLIPSSGTGLSQVVKSSSWVRSRTALMSLLGHNKERKASDEIFRTIKVPCQTLDAFCAQHHIERIDILKIDVEGAELSVLEGASESLRTGRIKNVQVEILDKKVSHEKKAKELAALLEGFGFRLHSRKSIASVGFLSDIRADDALFVRAEDESGKPPNILGEPG